MNHEASKQTVSLFDQSETQKWISDVKVIDVRERLRLRKDVDDRPEGNAMQGDLLRLEAGVQTLRCLTCNEIFEERENQIDHYKGTWHQFNLNLKLQGKPALPHAVFISGGADPDAASSGGDEAEDEDDFRVSGLPFVLFGDRSGRVISVYRCMLKLGDEPSHERRVSAFKDALNLQSIAFVLFNAGHFATGIYCSGKLAKHKTLHTYVTRAKQGTSQAAYDSQGHKAHSAGASLRRVNQRNLAQRVQELLASWKEDLDGCSHVFLRCSNNDRAVFFTGKAPVFKKHDCRILSIPFSTRRPTMKEIERICVRVTSALVYDNDANFTEVLRKSVIVRKISKRSPASGKASGLSACRGSDLVSSEDDACDLAGRESDSEESAEDYLNNSPLEEAVQEEALVDQSRFVRQHVTSRKLRSKNSVGKEARGRVKEQTFAVTEDHRGAEGENLMHKTTKKKIKSKNKKKKQTYSVDAKSDECSELASGEEKEASKGERKANKGERKSSKGERKSSKGERKSSKGEKEASKGGKEASKGEKESRFNSKSVANIQQESSDGTQGGSEADLEFEELSISARQFLDSNPEAKLWDSSAQINSSSIQRKRNQLRKKARKKAKHLKKGKEEEEEEKGRQTSEDNERLKAVSAAGRAGSCLCLTCEKPVKSSDAFSYAEFKFCSIQCLRVHRLVPPSG